MTYEEFHEFVTSLYADEYTYKGVLEFYWSNGDAENYRISHVTGGASGGNCWDDTVPRAYTNSDPIPTIEFLDLFIKICPNMTFLQHKIIMKDIVKTNLYTNYEYYGNYDNIIELTVNYKELYDKLVELNIITND